MKKKTVLANWGTANQGKSDTIKRIAKLIIANYPNAIIDIQIGDWLADIKILITIGQIIIGIESQGDPNSRQEESLINFEKLNCDLIICATRTYGSTVESVN